MNFITSDDLDVLIKNHNLSLLTSQDASLLDIAELQAIEEITGYLRQRYDVAALFSATSTARNPLCVLYCIDIMLYHLYSRITPKGIPEIRLTRYESAIAWLDSVMEGRIIPSLPENTGTPPGSDENAAQNFKIAGNPKFNHDY